MVKKYSDYIFSVKNTLWRIRYILKKFSIREEALIWIVSNQSARN